MSKNIWHTPSETTDTDNNLIIKDFVNRTYEIGWFDDNDMIFRNFRNNDTYDEEGMMKWCDVDDLVNDYERLQKELIRTRKALDVAVDALRRANNTYCAEEEDITIDLTESAAHKWQRTAYQMEMPISIALEQITALEQKDVK